MHAASVEAEPDARVDAESHTAGEADGEGSTRGQKERLDENDVWDIVLGLAAAGVVVLAIRIFGRWLPGIPK